MTASARNRRAVAISPGQAIAVEERESVADALERPDRACPHEDGEEDSGNRSAGNQARAEQCAGAQFGFLRLPCLALDPGSYQPPAKIGAVVAMGR